MRHSPTVLPVRPLVGIEVPEAYLYQSRERIDCKRLRADPTPSMLSHVNIEAMLVFFFPGEIRLVFGRTAWMLTPKRVLYQEFA